ncbi:MAG: acetyl-CoA carboxylase, carboxyltransferase subunit beta [Chitinophagales bacterium]
MSWFKRVKEGITTKTAEKKETPDGVWYKCDHCKKTMAMRQHRENVYVCEHCDYHARIGSKEYFSILFDHEQYETLFSEIQSTDSLGFTDKKSYKLRLKQTKRSSGLDDAIQVAVGKLDGYSLVVAAMDFTFIGGSMGSVVGERIAKAIDYSVENNIPLLIISKSGGARMMESALSLMQMAKTSARLTLLAEAKLPYFSLMTDPTTGGVSASFAMLGDLNLAEPKALIGFAGPRVIKETIKKDLPEGFQTSEFLLEHGFLDLIIHRKDLKAKLAELYAYFRN